jgi:hypothetical protein
MKSVLAIRELHRRVKLMRMLRPDDFKMMKGIEDTLSWVLNDLLSPEIERLFNSIMDHEGLSIGGNKVDKVQSDS